MNKERDVWGLGEAVPNALNSPESHHEISSMIKFYTNVKS